MMNLTQKFIVVTGSESELRTALDILKGFKAVTPLKHISEEAVRNVFDHNKNVLHLATSYKIDWGKFSPIILNLNKNSNFSTFTLSTSNLMEDFPKLLDELGIDVGDHVIHDSSDDTCKADCLLCKIRDGKSKRDEHILYQTDNFYVVPGLGAFFKGYLMIVPKRHVMSFAELTDDEFHEFERVLRDLRFILESIYHSKVFAFECGSGKGGTGKHSTSIVHAHFHLAPTDMPVFESVRKSGLSPALIELNSLSNYGRYPYMLYGDQNEDWYICSDPDSYFPRQHPRQILADYMGLKKGEYNWRTYAHEEELDVIANEFSDFIRNNFTKLPKWIQESTKHLMTP